jgi:hypothetical protein
MANFCRARLSLDVGELLGDLVVAQLEQVHAANEATVPVVAPPLDNTLGEPMRQAIGSFFDHNRDWLAALLDSGRKAGAMGFQGPPDQAAKTIIAALEGGMLVARPYSDTAVLDVVIDRLLAEFSLRQPA